MHDEVRLRVGHRVAHFGQHANPLAHRRRGAARVLDQVLARDVFHRVVQASILRRAAVNEARDARMTEFGQDASLL